MIVIMAIVTSNVLAFGLWPSSAINELHQLMIDTMDAFSESLGGITFSFLRASDEDIDSPKFMAIETSHRTVFTSLLKSLREAKYEHYVRGTEKQYHQEMLLVKSMQRLSQNIGGLRSAALTQFSLLKKVRRHELEGPGEPIPMEDRPGTSNDSNRLFTPPAAHNSFPAMHESGPSTSASSVRSGSIGGNTESIFPDGSASAVYEEFIYHLGPPMVIIPSFFSFRITN